MHSLATNCGASTNLTPMKKDCADPREKVQEGNQRWPFPCHKGLFHTQPNRLTHPLTLLLSDLIFIL